MVDDTMNEAATAELARRESEWGIPQDAGDVTPTTKTTTTTKPS